MIVIIIIKKNNEIELKIKNDLNCIIKFIYNLYP